MELRRAEVAKKRPTWMLAITGLALIAAVGLIFFALWSKHRSDKANEEKERADLIAKQAVEDAKEAQERVEKLSNDLADLDKKVSSAINAVVAAQNDADRKRAAADLDKLQQQKRDMEQRIAAAKAAADKANRAKGLHISQECLDNPLAKGCN